MQDEIIDKITALREVSYSVIFTFTALLMSNTSIKFTLSHALTPSGVCKRKSIYFLQLPPAQSRLEDTYRLVLNLYR
jgi:hypothetical protein